MNTSQIRAIFTLFAVQLKNGTDHQPAQFPQIQDQIHIRNQYQAYQMQA